MNNNKLNIFKVIIGITSYDVKGKDFNDLLDNRLTKRQSIYWHNIEWIQDGNIISIDRDTFEYSGWTREEMIQDCIINQKEIEYLKEDFKIWLEARKSLNKRFGYKSQY